MSEAIGCAVLAALLLAAGSRLQRPAIVGAGLIVLGFGEALVILIVHGTDRSLAAVPAAALLLGAGELCFGLAEGVGGTPAERRRRLAWVGGVAASAAALAFIVLGADVIALRRSAVATIAGALLAALAVWLLTRAVRALAGDS